MSRPACQGSCRGKERAVKDARRGGAFSPRQGVFGDGLKNIYEKYDFFEKTLDFFEKKCYNSKVLGYVPLAQLDRASDYGSEGRGFESSAARQKNRHSSN